MRFCSIWQNVNHPFLQCVMPVSHLVADLIIRSTVMASSVLLFNSYAVMVEFLKHSVLICRMKTVLKSPITIIETEYLSATPMALSSGSLVDLDYKEGWLTLMFPDTVEMTQWLKDPFPDHSPPHGIWSSNQWYSPAKNSAPGTLIFLKMLNHKQLDYCLWLQLSYKPTEAGTPHSRPACRLSFVYYVCKPMTQGSGSLQVWSL